MSAPLANVVHEKSLPLNPPDTPALLRCDIVHHATSQTGRCAESSEVSSVWRHCRDTSTGGPEAFPKEQSLSRIHCTAETPLLEAQRHRCSSRKASRSIQANVVRRLLSYLNLLPFCLAQLGCELPFVFSACFHLSWHRLPSHLQKPCLVALGLPSRVLLQGIH